MAATTFWADSFTPPVSNHPGAGYELAVAFVSSAAGTITAIQFWKIPTDTGTHIGTIYRESDQAVMGTVTFTGETASGWQTMAFASAIPIAAGVRYRASVSHLVAYGLVASLPGPMVSNTVTTDAGGCWNNAGVYPSINIAEVYFTDIVGDFPFVGTEARVTQAIGEVFLQPSPGAAVTQAVGEVWVTMPDIPVCVTQAVAEVWVLNTPTTYVIATQVCAEVWVPSPPPVVPPAYRPYNVSAEVV